MEEEKERVEEEELSASKRERELERRLEEESYNLEKFRDIQEEVSNLNKSLSNCIAIAADSITNFSLKRRYDSMRQSNHNSYVRANRAMDNAIVEKEKEITRLQDERDQIEEEKKQEQKN